MAHRAVAALSEERGDQEARYDLIGQAVSDLTAKAPAIEAMRSSLDDLSSDTVFEAVEVAPGGILIDKDNRFEASGTVYVTLKYDGTKDGLAMSDSYPALIRGHIGDDGASVDDVAVDTASFYGAAEEE